MSDRTGEGYAFTKVAMLFSMAIVFCFSVIMLFSPAAHATVTAVSTGTNHTCAVVDRVAKCWGDNTSGKLGNNGIFGVSSPATVYTKASPASPLYGKSVTKISAGNTHTCAVANARVYCWGNNDYGQLGNRSTWSSNVPVAVTIGGNSALQGKEVVDVTAGNGYTCAAASDGTVACWGRNTNGQLGNNSTTDTNYPVAVSTGSGSALNGKKVKKLATLKGNVATMCVITTEAKAVCWGQGYAGQLGNGGGKSGQVSDGYHKENTGKGNQCIYFAYDINNMHGYDLHTSSDKSIPVAVDTSLTFESIIIFGDGGGKVPPVIVTNQNTTVTYSWSGHGYTYITGKTAGNPSLAYYWGGSTSYDLEVTCKNRNGHHGAGDSTYFDASITRTYSGASTPVGPQYQGTGTPLSGRSLSNISGNAYPGADFGSLFCGIRTDKLAYCDTHGSSSLKDGQTGSNYRCTTTKNSWGFDETVCPPESSGPQQVYSDGWLAGKTMTAIDTSYSGHTCVIANGEVGCWGENGDGQLGVGNRTNRVVPTKVGL